MKNFLNFYKNLFKGLAYLFIIFFDCFLFSAVPLLCFIFQFMLVDISAIIHITIFIFGIFMIYISKLFHEFLYNAGIYVHDSSNGRV